MYNGRLMSLLLARLEAAGLEPGLSPPLPQRAPAERASASDQRGEGQGGGGHGGRVLVPSGELLERWNFKHRGLPFVSQPEPNAHGEPPAYALNVDPTHAPAPTELECPLKAIKPGGHRGPLLGVGFVD